MEKVIILGTGNAGVKNCYNTCFALKNKNEYLLVDAGGGNGILKQLELAQKYQEENMEELSKIYLEQGQEAMMKKIFDDLSKELYNPLYKELDNAKYTEFTFKFEMVEKDGKWLIDKISKEK